MLMGSTVILAAGAFPVKGGDGERLLRAAKRVVACDAAAISYHRRFHRWPEVVIGDLDSVVLPSHAKVSSHIVRDADTETNDLTKAIRYCRSKGWNDLVIVGATGLREDHTIGNVYRALAEGVKIVTDHGVFYPVADKFVLRAPPDTGVSIFAPDPKTKMTSHGLRWPLKGVKFNHPWCATLNRVSDLGKITLTTTRPCFVFVERRPDLKRVILSLGSNLSKRRCSREEFLSAARSLIESIAYIVDASEIIETEGVDVPEEYRDFKFLNQVLLVDTQLSPNRLLSEIHRIENHLGRVRTVRNGPRTIDIDIIDYAGKVMNTKNLTLPHPRAKKRAFVMEPLQSLGLTLGRRA